MLGYLFLYDHPACAPQRSVDAGFPHHSFNLHRRVVWKPANILCLDLSIYSAAAAMMQLCHPPALPHHEITYRILPSPFTKHTALNRRDIFIYIYLE